MCWLFSAPNKAIPLIQFLNAKFMKIADLGPRQAPKLEYFAKNKFFPQKNDLPRRHRTYIARTKTFRRRPGRLLNVLCTFNSRPMSKGLDVWKISVPVYAFKYFPKTHTGIMILYQWKIYFIWALDYISIIFLT